MIEITALASGSTGNCYRVTDGKTPLLLEAGINYKQIQRGLNYQVTSLAGCLVSHGHADHAKAVKDMVKAGIDCYMSLGTIGALGISGHRIKPVKAKEQFKLGTWTILPFDTVHDAAEPLGFLLANRAGDKLLYLTDTAYCRYRFRRLTHLMLEANHSLDILRENVANGTVPVDLKNRIIRTHFGLDNVKEFLRANDLSRVQEIWLIHLSSENSHAQRFKTEIQQLTGKPTYIA
ncbi:MBL fold metallo-hydrolase [Desulfoscipio geothermicus]|uniref:Phosphoribosyl 1,2-cyclic phosphodiesterase n=1 Tax=Desulfoscipio geothermicus DSM 3669 TaxID=1121426 RepID=A0A1I6ECC0_9FIRM|nr:MBL fold metallo-hydrolase [Desulfoscipio geothermicus]SFR15374.1 Phosphoribosyl 1,2-cyclic phosphodiesterase [Desulfoscipio geothermicus DSM 3669]